VTNSAGNIQTGSVNTAGSTSGNGGNIVINAAGSVATDERRDLHHQRRRARAGRSAQGADAAT
jgi:hypothetical protein